MSYADIILPEFEHETANTRKVLECVPDDKLGWQAHPKSNTIGWNANHLAEIVNWVEGTLSQTEWEIAPADGPKYESPNLTSVAEILALFDRGVADSIAAFKAVKDEAMGEMWSLVEAGKPLFTMPRAAVIRSFVLNHQVHHRAILCTYLRLNDIPVPGMYGPSGDEQ